MTSVLGDIPQLMKKANLENEALNGKPVTETINDLVKAVVDPFQALAEKKTVVRDAAAEIPEDTGTTTEIAQPIEENTSDDTSFDAEDDLD